MQTITLEELHNLLDQAHAVNVNGTLYFVGYDEEGPFIADNDQEGYVSFSEVDGDIEVRADGFFFHVAEKPIMLKLLVAFVL
jgi:hypothetical protein